MSQQKRGQTGVVVLAMVLLILVVSSFFLLQALNEAARVARYDDEHTRRVLQEAKAALIGYAVSYPERATDTSKGPGHLPCPDYTYQGGADPVGSADSCSLAAKTETGLLPWLTLDTNDLRDGSGAPLWYAVANDYRANSNAILNSETAGGIQVDGNPADVVAVIIAPGPPVGDQVRNPRDMTAFYHPANYLEGENASRGDNRFASTGTGLFNDRLITITRRELMAAVEQRVLKEVAGALNRYFHDPDGDDVNGVDPDCSAAAIDCDDGYPWLSPFSNPSTSAYVGTLATVNGLLPLERLNVPFAAPFTINWNIPAGGSFSASGIAPPTAGCLRNPVCVYSSPLGAAILSGPMQGKSDGSWAAGTCVWQAEKQLLCQNQRSFAVGGRLLERTYRITFTALNFGIKPPSTSAPRTHSLAFTSSTQLPASAGLTLALDDADVTSGGHLVLGSASLTLHAGDTIGILQVDAVPFDLEVDRDDGSGPPESPTPGELPAWLVSNHWQEFLYLRYASAYAPGNSGKHCTDSGAGPCLSVVWNRGSELPAVTLDAVPAVLVLAGPALAGQTRPSGNLGAYFEAENASADERFSKQPFSTGFDDRLLILDPYK